MIVTRRQMFAAGGVVAGASIFPLAKIVNAQRGAPPPRTEDKFLLHVGKENARLIKLARQGRLRSEHLASLAANAKLWALSIDDAQNAQFKAAATKAKTDSRFGLDDHAQHGKRAAEVKKLFDLDIADEMSTMPVLQPAQRTAALNTLAREGLTPSLLRMAASLEAQAAQMAVREKDGGGSERFVLVQDSIAPYCGYFPYLEISMMITCTAAQWLVGAGQVACAVAVTWTIVWKLAC